MNHLRCELCGALCDGPCSGCAAVGHCSHDHRERMHDAETCRRMRAQKQRSDELSTGLPALPSPPSSVSTGKWQCEVLEQAGGHMQGPLRFECECAFDDVGNDGLECNGWGNLHPAKRPDLSDVIGGADPLVPKSWESYYCFRGLDWTSPVAMAMYGPLTCLNLLEEGCGLESAEELVVHVIGAQNEPLQAPAWFELACLAPAVTFHFAFVGPSIPQAAEPRLEFRPPCKHTGGVTVTAWREEYHRARMHMPDPDCIIALDGGISVGPVGPKKGGWAASLRTAASEMVPFAATDRLEEACERAKVEMEASGLQPRSSVEVNAFRRPPPVPIGPDHNLPQFRCDPSLFPSFFICHFLSLLRSDSERPMAPAHVQSGFRGEGFYVTPMTDAQVYEGRHSPLSYCMCEDLLLHRSKVGVHQKWCPRNCQIGLVTGG